MSDRKLPQCRAETSLRREKRAAPLFLSLSFISTTLRDRYGRGMSRGNVEQRDGVDSRSVPSTNHSQKLAFADSYISYSIYAYRLRSILVRWRVKSTSRESTAVPLTLDAPRPSHRTSLRARTRRRRQFEESTSASKRIESVTSRSSISMILSRKRPAQRIVRAPRRFRVQRETRT